MLLTRVINIYSILVIIHIGSYYYKQRWCRIIATGEFIFLGSLGFS